MSAVTDKPAIILPARTASHLVLLGMRNKWAWAALAVILASVAAVPAPAKVPVGLALSGVLLAPAMARAKDRTARIPPDAPCWRDANQPVQFAALLRRPGTPKLTWRQARCTVRGAELQIAPFTRWRGATPEQLCLAGATVGPLRTGTFQDDRLKGNVFRIFDLELSADRLLLAVDHTYAEQVQVVLRSRTQGS